MANITQQVTNQAGSDSSTATTQRSQTATGNKNTTSNSTQNKTVGSSTVTTRTDGSKKSAVTNDDHALTVTFEVLLGGALPCKRITL